MVEILHLAVVIRCKNTYTFLLLYTDPKRVLHKAITILPCLVLTKEENDPIWKRT